MASSRSSPTTVIFASGRVADVDLRMDEELSESALRRVAWLHKAEIPDGFLSSFGERFLFLVYRTIVVHKESFLIGAFDDQKLIGFICGSTDTGSLYRRFARTRVFQASLFLAPRIFSPRVVRGIFETIMYPKRPLLNLPRAAILNFAVDPSSRGKGVGGRLLHALGREFHRRGETAIRIVCGADQKSAQRLYLRNGASEVCSLELHHGVTSLVMTWKTALADRSLIARAHDAGEQSDSESEQLRRPS
jgi:ribosomal protein S18 acetylase RimI-like enzyme